MHIGLNCNSAIELDYGKISFLHIFLFVFEGNNHYFKLEYNEKNYNVIGLSMNKNSENPNKTVVKISDPAKTQKNNTGIIFLGIFILIAISAIIYMMVSSTPETSELVKNISVVLFVFSFILLAVMTILLFIQIVNLTNLMKDEVKPILRSTRETVNDIKGTVSFLGDKAVSPVIDTNAKIAGINKIIKILIPKKEEKKGS